jgi:hypothetical protein
MGSCHPGLSPSISIYLSECIFSGPLAAQAVLPVCVRGTLIFPYTPLHAPTRPLTGAYALLIALPVNALKRHGRMRIHARVSAVIVQTCERESRTAPVL